MPNLANDEGSFEEPLLSGNKTTQRPVSAFLGVLGALLALASFPLAAYYVSVIGQVNVLDEDPIAELMILIVLITFALAVLTSLAKISWSWNHNLASSESLTILGPLIWRHSHHPPLPHFRQHEICIRGKRFCCGCTGAALGIVLGGFIIALVELTSFAPDSSEAWNYVTGFPDQWAPSGDETPSPVRVFYQHRGVEPTNRKLT
ncbi:MAG: hypothetical protein ACXACI_00895 [Candidatus Hodarchaeales archaeon]